MKRQKKILTVMIVLFVTISVIPGIIWAQPQGALTGFEKIDENENLVLYANTKTGVVAVKDKSGGYVWYSNPPGADEDKIAQGIFKTNMSSQLIVQYINSRGHRFQVNSFAGSINKNGMIAEKVGNGIKYSFYFPKEQFTIPVLYSLGKDYLEASIVVSEIIEKDSESRITHISFMPYFGAGSMEDTGYMMVPDGSGALIYFNNGKQHFSDYSQEVYGRDPVYSKQFEVLQSETVRMPVFGIQNGEQGLLAIITQGDALASVNASVSGSKTSYNNVYAGFQLRAVDTMIMREREGNAKDVVISAQDISNVDACTIRYYLLGNNESGYSGMAIRYQQYLMEEKGLTKKLSTDETIPFYLELYGAAKRRESVLGIPVDVLKPLTTYSDVIRITQDLKKEGIDNIVIKYSGWSENGVISRIPAKLRLENKLGGKKDFLDLLSYIEENNISLYPNADFVNFYRGGNGFSRFFDAAKTVSGAPGLQYMYNLVTYFRDYSQKPWYLLSPAKMETAVKKFYVAHSELKLKGVSVDTLGSISYSDYGKRPIDRVSSVKIFEKAMGYLKENMKSLMTENANAYAIAYADHLLCIPMHASHFDIEDEEIPFYQIVLHGIVPYGTSPLNLSSNLELEMLKAIETGSSPMYAWIGQEGEMVVRTRLAHLYSANYKLWLEDAVKRYMEINKVLVKVQDQKIMLHQKLYDGVYETVYENGIQVIVNYLDKEVTVKGVKLEARSYKVLEGGDRS